MERHFQGIFPWHGYDVTPMGGNRVSIENKEFDFNSNIQNAISNTQPNFRNLNDDVISTFNIVLKNLDYKS